MIFKIESYDPFKKHSYALLVCFYYYCYNYYNYNFKVVLLLLIFVTLDFCVFILHLFIDPVSVSPWLVSSCVPLFGHVPVLIILSEPPFTCVQFITLITQYICDRANETRDVRIHLQALFKKDVVKNTGRVQTPANWYGKGKTQDSPVNRRGWSAGNIVQGGKTKIGNPNTR